MRWWHRCATVLLQANIQSSQRVPARKQRRPDVEASESEKFAAIGTRRVVRISCTFEADALQRPWHLLIGRTGGTAIRRYKRETVSCYIAPPSTARMRGPRNVGRWGRRADFGL
ncbi:hypothetical protein BDU57DRAFT_522048 [Ampelomyces quisqualis]|uniref:Uncharacterized protein n=1 Tax=Ampelomyces quisqualis TaxID=50730 RepID=A0A6A5QEK5_AMPQU|nr:hypothetical protein BDU57DRAFT_522048 [Ampelomyces quisqualis]